MIYQHRVLPSNLPEDAAPPPRRPHPPSGAGHFKETLMKPATIVWTLSMFEIMRAVWIVRRYSDDGDLDAALFRMPVPDFFRLRARVVCAIGLAMTAQIMWWLP